MNIEILKLNIRFILFCCYFESNKKLKNMFIISDTSSFFARKTTLKKKNFNLYYLDKKNNIIKINKNTHMTSIFLRLIKNKRMGTFFSFTSI